MYEQSKQTKRHINVGVEEEDLGCSVELIAICRIIKCRVPQSPHL